MMPAASHSRTPCAREGGPLKLHRDCGFGEVSIARLEPPRPAFAPFADHGTALAINNTTVGVAPLSAGSEGAKRIRNAAQAAGRIPRSAKTGTGRGGTRNRADRVSHALTMAQIARLKAAECHSRQIGLPFTRMISIHWEAAGIPVERIAKATGHFTDLLAKALARHGSATAWLWVHENGDGKGGHCHLLVHVPAELVNRVTALQRGWLRRITGKPYRARVIHSRPIGGRLGLERGNPELHMLNLEVAFAYILKGASPEAASQFGLERLESGGRVIGKRCGTSQNIGAKARKAKE